MLKIAFAIYRDWGYTIFKNILQFQENEKNFVLDTLIIADSYVYTPDISLPKTFNTYVIDPNNTEELFTILKTSKIDIVCFYSWSFIVKEPLLNSFICLCLHPSKLPKYRGGTPIQHQLVNGEKKSAVSIFRMAKGIDNGDIYKQAQISLSGDINDIFSRMENQGTILTKQLIHHAINNKLSFTPQKNLEKFPPNKRRTPEQSKIDIEELKFMAFDEVYNLVRGLLDPYPNLHIIIQNYKLLIQKIKKSKDLQRNGILITKDTLIENIIGKKKLFFKLKDAYAECTEYKIAEL